MRQLIYKDLFFFRVVWLVYVIVPFIFFGLNPDGEKLFPASCLLITATSSTVLIAIDERNKSGVMLNSLPVSRKEIVIARYISSAIFVIGGMIATMLAVFLVRSIAGIGDIGIYHPSLYIEIPWYIVARGLLFSVIFIVTLLPSYYGVGSKVVRGICTGITTGIGILIGMFMTDRWNQGSSFSNWIMAPAHIGMIILGGIVLASIYITSMFITIRMYETRDI
ncbi:ABC-2 transporter permease [Bacillus cytotoxicus]|uniref:ABC transporter permease component n=2 Tax=Bacillus cytotoxicus TaxID=580165 RepID=A0AAX2CKM9_9BACI|nr:MULTISPECIES: ABC-2 transporter permease [Bacillus cereus group]ABS23139.1 putative ABC transporter permease component [Bacillus cytotoxicus NVH 391-98]AWC29792.1 ABC-2 transporter permease [Bacillus cytotoxicus]AWC33796.1 ABC-2 transporter permease [Bacillus cytotoxicus]AWC37776.1 ABC-2 transporter permease [Bacillus cytotoxicus]AWC41923.1 ABC-2 transporter permease [Bacillus cytotoxicus]